MLVIHNCRECPMGSIPDRPQGNGLFRFFCQHPDRSATMDTCQGIDNKPLNCDCPLFRSSLTISLAPEILESRNPE